ncbi:MAG: molybdenum cofactor biosynthesis protein MoaE [bacterium]
MVKLVSEKIRLDDVLAQVEDPATGGVALFLGRVRNHAKGRAVAEMDYEAYPEMALKKMQEIEEQARKRWPVSKIMIVHRVGRLQLGEVSVVIAVASSHRAEAFEACRFAIDTLKETVPIWKKEYFADGEDAWVKGVVPKTVL